jgi:hypothetical protein
MLAEVRGSTTPIECLCTKGLGLLPHSQDIALWNGPPSKFEAQVQQNSWRTTSHEHQQMSCII